MGRAVAASVFWPRPTTCEGQREPTDGSCGLPTGVGLVLGPALQKPLSSNKQITNYETRRTKQRAPKGLDGVGPGYRDIDPLKMIPTTHWGLCWMYRGGAIFLQRTFVEATLRSNEEAITGPPTVLF